MSGEKRATCVARVRDLKAGPALGGEAGSGRLASEVCDFSKRARLSDRDLIPVSPPDYQV